MLLRRNRRSEEPELELLVGDLEEPEPKAAEPEPPSDAGAVAAILVAGVLFFRALELAAANHYHLRIVSDTARIGYDLRWVVGADCALGAFVLAASPRFARWFAPAGPWRLARLCLASFGFLIASLSFQPLLLWFMLGWPPTGRLANLFIGFLDPVSAATLPVVLGALLVLVSAKLPRALETSSEDGPEIEP